MNRPTIQMFPVRLAPLGASDSYTYRNGVVAYYSPGFIHIHADVSEPAITIPRYAWPVIVAVAKAMGLSATEAAQLAEAAEAYAR